MKKYFWKLDVLRSLALISVLLFHLFPSVFKGVAAIGAETPFTHMWIIAIELQFYLLFPIVFLLIKSLRNFERAFSIFLIVLITGLMTLVSPIMMLLGESETVLYYSTLSRMFPLFIGCVAGIIFCDGNISGVKICKFLKEHSAFKCILVFGNITLFLFLIFHVEGYETWLAIFGHTLISIWCSMLVLAVAADDAQKRNVPKIVNLLSKYSFEIYLWQYPTIFVFNHIFSGRIVASLISIPFIFLEAFMTKKFVKNTSLWISKVRAEKIPTADENIRIRKSYNGKNDLVLSMIHSRKEALKIGKGIYVVK